MSLFGDFVRIVTIFFVIQLHLVSSSRSQPNGYFNRNVSSSPDLFDSHRTIDNNNSTMNSWTVSEKTGHDKATQTIIDDAHNHSNKLTKIFVEKHSRRFVRMASPSQNGTFVPPTSGNNRHLRGNYSHDNAAEQYREHLEELKKIPMIQTRLASVEASLETHQKRFDDQARAEDQTVTKREEEGNTVAELEKKLVNQIKQNTKLIEDQKQKQSQEKWQECVLAVKKRTPNSFKTAEKILMDLNDKDTINVIVKEVYKHEQANFDLVLAFGEHLKDSAIRFLVYNALHYEMLDGGHNDPLKGIKLAESMEKNIVHRSDNQTKAQATTLVNTLKSSAKAVTVEKLKDALQNGRDFPSDKVKELSRKVFLFNHDLFGDIWTQLVHEVYWKLDRETLYGAIKRQELEGQKVLALGAVYKKLKRTDIDRVTRRFIIFATEAKEILQRISTGSHWKAILEGMINDFPKSLKNAVFASRVCILNHKEYLYPQHMHGFNLLRLNMNTSARLSNLMVWILDVDESYGFDYRIRNVELNQYLYAPNDSLKLDSLRRFACTWNSASDVGDAGRWRLESKGDYVYIKNVLREEYLYAASDPFKYHGERCVFTWAPKERVSQEVWSIEDFS